MSNTISYVTGFCNCDGGNNDTSNLIQLQLKCSTQINSEIYDQEKLDLLCAECQNILLAWHSGSSDNLGLNSWVQAPFQRQRFVGLCLWSIFFGGSFINFWQQILNLESGKLAASSIPASELVNFNSQSEFDHRIKFLQPFQLKIFNRL